MYKHMLFATDLTDVSENITHRIKALADFHNAKLSVIHVIEPIPSYGYPSITELEIPIRNHANQMIEELAKILTINQKDCYIEYGSVKAQVIQKADDLGVDLLCVGSHGRYGLARLLGSSANAIVNGAECDVLVLRANR